MTLTYRPRRRHLPLLVPAAALLASAGATADNASGDSPAFKAGDLVVSRSVYDNRASNVAIGTVLPPGCQATTAGCSAATGAPYDGTYPTVFNDDGYDSSFGVTSRIFLDDMLPSGTVVNSLEVPNSLQRGVTATSDQLVTSFSSKSELSLNLSTDRRVLSFMGYVAPVDAIDVSNANTVTGPDPSNPDGQVFERGIATVDANGHFTFTKTNAYSGNNGRAAILNSAINAFYTAGNAGNGGTPQPAGVVLGAGAQLVARSAQPEVMQNPGDPTPVGSFSVTELGAKADKIGKDDNFRGLTVFNNVVYFSKGSGGNGVNTVYFIDTSGTACPHGVGLPAPGASLPTTPLTYDAGTVAQTGLPNNMCILAGFPAVSNKVVPATVFPFGIWFADAHTLYVADEGDGYVGGADLYTHAAAQTSAGLQKWVLDDASSTWKLAYTLQAGLDLGAAYTVNGYPTGSNVATSLPWAPATAGLRNLTGRVDGRGAVTLWAITSTVSGSGDVGADPNRLVTVVDPLANTDGTKAAGEHFRTLRTARSGEVLRGVSLAPVGGQNAQ